MANEDQVKDIIHRWVSHRYILYYFNATYLRQLAHHSICRDASGE